MFGLLCNIITYYIYINNANNRTKLRRRFQCSWQYIILICYYICIFLWFCQGFVVIALRCYVSSESCRCACTVSGGDHHNHTSCLALEFSREPTLLSAHYCTFSLSMYLKLFTVYFKFSKASYSEKYREKYQGTPQAQYKLKRKL